MRLPMAKQCYAAITSSLIISLRFQALDALLELAESPNQFARQLCCFIPLRNSPEESKQALTSVMAEAATESGFEELSRISACVQASISNVCRLNTTPISLILKILAPSGREFQYDLEMFDKTV